MTGPVVRPAIWSRLNNKGANNQLAFKSPWRYLTVMMGLVMLLSIIAAPAVAQQNPGVSGGDVSIAPTSAQGPAVPSDHPGNRSAGAHRPWQKAARKT